MATSGNKSGQLCKPKYKAAYTGLYVYSKGFGESWFGERSLYKALKRSH